MELVIYGGMSTYDFDSTDAWSSLCMTMAYGSRLRPRHGSTFASCSTA